MFLRTPDGTRLHYQVSGRGTPPLLFLHGWCCNLTHWDRQAAEFEPRHRVVRLDLRGHGRSDAPAGEYRIEQLADDVAWLASALRLRPAIVVAHAFSGPIALDLAVRHVQPVRALVLVDSALGEGTTREAAAAQPQAQRLAGLEYPAPLMEMFRAFFHPTTLARIADRVVAGVEKTPQHVAVNSSLSSASTNSLELAKQVQQRVLYVGAGWRRLPYQLREAFAHIEFGQVVGAGHFVQLEAPEQFNAMLRRFVQQVRA